MFLKFIKGKENINIHLDTKPLSSMKCTTKYFALIKKNKIQPTFERNESLHSIPIRVNN
ncbi:hypothetical protein BD809_108134 [Aquimarina intermedia]|uniref:Uncharacterized protein n=1 Tax=Aquimarina intermedia TaxID=350814 RepID=A0A5S5C187_9FLAO|nr:hypothetical protein BD809_108134 [Aquimarina intermedia]